MKYSKLFLASAAGTLIAPAAGFAAGVKKPLNIIYIMSDDHTSQAIGAYGSRLAPLNPTPTIDKLAAEGIVFDNVFCGNSISTPSRATIITGQYSHRNGVLTLDETLLPSQQYLAKEMKALGYQTAMVGKWHLGCEPSSFDYYSVFTEAGGQGKYFNPLLASSDCNSNPFPLNTKRYEGYCSDIVTDVTLDWFETKRDPDKPFFVMHHYKAPHDDFEFAPRYADYLADVDIPVPASLLDRDGFGSVATRGVNDSLNDWIGTSTSARNRFRSYVAMYGIDTGNEREDTIEAYEEYLRRYLRCVKGVDDNLERLFTYLKDEGLWDNTVIIYTGDQGMILSEHDLQDKRWMYEESLRMPFIMKVPGAKTKGGTHNGAMIQNVDFAPTILSLAGANETPKYMQGKDFSSIFFSGKEPAGWRDAIYYRYWMHLIHHNVPAHFGIRTKDYKLIFFYGRHYDPTRYGESSMWWLKDCELPIIEPTPVAFELYDLKKDPHEMVNVAEDPAYAEVLAKLKRELLELKAEVGDDDKQNEDVLELIEEYFK